MSEQSQDRLLQSVVVLLNDIICNVDEKQFNPKESTNLIRRLKLLAPLFEELREMKRSSAKNVSTSLQAFLKAFQSAGKLQRQCQSGSKLFLVLSRDYVTSQFNEVTSQLQQALDCLPYDRLGFSDEVQEQVELVRDQLKRAKSRSETSDRELYMDAMTILSQKDEVNNDVKVLRRFAEKLRLTTTSDLKQESHTLQNLKTSEFANDKLLKEIAQILTKLNTMLIYWEALDISKSRNSKSILEGGVEKPNSISVPDDFRCPISLELMKDPVIIATGQTYERACIQKWLDAGHRTCPKTQQILPQLMLTPNYALRSLIEQWSKTNGVNVSRECGSSLAEDGATIRLLLEKLSSGQINAQRTAARDLRLLARQCVENRICIAEAGAIPLLINLLNSEDLKVQEHAVTALLNLSIYGPNKSLIVAAGAINPIVEVLKGGSMEARENSAATLFSLSVSDENKVMIGASGAIPALVNLLHQGTHRGKKDAATALFNLCIYQGNKSRAVKTAVIPLLMQLLVNPAAGLVDEALAILAILISHEEARNAISSAFPVPVLVGLIISGSHRGKENAAAILLSLSLNNSAHIVATCQHGAFVPLTELASHGTARAKRKAKALLELMSKTGGCN